MITTLFNGNVITETGIEYGGLVFEDGRILRVFQGDDYQPSDLSIDCGGDYISPGFVDIHVHGCMGGDMMDSTPEAIHEITGLHCKHGTTSIVPTTLSHSHESIKQALVNLAETMQLPRHGARILGAQIESNYFAPVMAGAQNPAYLYSPQDDDYMDFVRTGVVRRLAAAPELPGSLEMGRKLSRMGIQMSIAHSNGKHQDVINAIEAGYTTLTHIYNAQSSISSVLLWPDGGVCEASLLHDEILVECICDGHHLSSLLLQLIYKIKGSDGMIAITDSVYAGATEGQYLLGGVDIIVEDGICLLKDRSAFAGSLATMDLCLRTLHQTAGIPLHEAVKICSLTPARAIGEEEIGRLAPGYYADINLFDRELNLKKTFVEGKEFS